MLLFVCLFFSRKTLLVVHWGKELKGFKLEPGRSERVHSKVPGKKHDESLEFKKAKKKYKIKSQNRF